MKVLMTGNEAVARGVWEAGAQFASAYPGTPSTEIMECLAKFDKKDIYAEWAPNEKVSMESALGASLARGPFICFHEVRGCERIRGSMDVLFLYRMRSRYGGGCRG